MELNQLNTEMLVYKKGEDKNKLQLWNFHIH